MLVPRIPARRPTLTPGRRPLERVRRRRQKPGALINVNLTGPVDLSLTWTAPTEQRVPLPRGSLVSVGNGSLLISDREITIAGPRPFAHAPEEIFAVGVVVDPYARTVAMINVRGEPEALYVRGRSAPLLA